MEKDLISIVVPVYNNEKYIEYCIESIQKQTYKNLEIIIVNDGSTDRSLELIKKIADDDKRISFYNTENMGVCHSRNLGVEKSNGKWISFVDSDDWIEPNFCELLLKKAKEYNADYVGCGYNKVIGNNIKKINSDGRILEYTKDEFLIKLLNVQTSYGLIMKLVKAEYAKKVKFNEDIKVAEDAFFNMQLCDYLNKIVICNEALYNYRVNIDSAVRKFDEGYSNKYGKSMEVISAYIKNKYSDEDVLKNLNNFVVYHLMLVCVNYIYNPDNKSGSKLKLLKDTCEESLYKDAVKYSNYNELSMTRKITLFTIKHKLYFITALICMYRQKQIHSK